MNDVAAEALWRRLARRSLTIPAVSLAWALTVSTLPLTLPLAALHDVAHRPRRWGWTRVVAMAALYLSFEVVGLLLLGLHTLWPSRGPRWREAAYRLQRWWCRGIFRGGRRLLGFRFEVTGADCAAPGPVLVLVRHASVIDTLIPVVLIADAHGLHLRWVLKQELRWAPCIDVLGQRVPNAFVDRRGADSARAVAQVRALARHLGPRDGVLIFPEGTRFSAARLERLRAHPEPALRADAERYQRVLPPRLGGTSALFEAAPEADVVVLVHAGFDSVRTFGDLARGTLADTTVRARLWRIPAAEIPRAPDARSEWLRSLWSEVDRTVEALSDSHSARQVV